MKFNRNNGEELNDGLLIYGTKETLRDEETREYLGSTFKSKGRLFYKIKSYKADDVEQYFGISEKLDLKLKTYYVPDLDTTMIVHLNGEYYDVVKVDRASDKLHSFLYLQLRKEL